MIQLKQYVKVQSIDEAYALNQNKRNVIIGGMHWLKMSRRNAGIGIDLSGLGLDKIEETEDAFEIGCMTSLRTLELDEALNEYCNGAVRDAVKDIVGVQFRNTATIGGSIFGRYGFSDVLTVFLAMDTSVVCHHAGEIPLEEFAQMKYDRDVVEKIIVKKSPIKMAYQAIRRIRTDFPALTCAVSCVDGQYRAAVGARPAKARLILDEDNILADGITQASATAFGEAVADKLNYSTNMRGSAEYRKMTTPVLVRRALMQIAED
ncbi:MAG: FAD binding domain-containing protein [Eubacterium sp.]|nr:FAD binding domain-containing protein [Candidatus Colimonas fimequi]